LHYPPSLEEEPEKFKELYANRVREKEDKDKLIKDPLERVKVVD